MIGIAIFLVAGITAVVLENHVPKNTPYAMVIGSFFGFFLLWLGHSYLRTLDVDVQFRYFAGYAMLSLLSTIGLNLYVLVKKRRLLAGSGMALIVTAPAFAITLFFANAYINNVAIELPKFPIQSMAFIYVAIICSVIVLSLMYLAGRYGTNEIELEADGGSGGQPDE